MAAVCYLKALWCLLMLHSISLRPAGIQIYHKEPMTQGCDVWLGSLSLEKSIEGWTSELIPWTSKCYGAFKEWVPFWTAQSENQKAQSLGEENLFSQRVRKMLFIWERLSCETRLWWTLKEKPFCCNANVQLPISRCVLQRKAFAEEIGPPTLSFPFF